MTLEEASQIYYINLEIKRIQLDIVKLEEGRTYSKAITYSDMPKGSIRDTTEDINDYLDKERQLRDMLRYSLHRLQQARIMMEQSLSTIEDTETRLIIRLRCVNNMSWREIGAELSMSHTTAMRIFYNFWKVAPNAPPKCDIV